MTPIIHRLKQFDHRFPEANCIKVVKSGADIQIIFKCLRAARRASRIRSKILQSIIKIFELGKKCDPFVGLREAFVTSHNLRQ